MQGKKLRVLALCDGLSGGLIAFTNLGIDVEYHAVEFDKHARKLSDSNFGCKIIRWQDDVTKVTKEDIEFHGPFDWVIFGAPCQTISVAGNGTGLFGKSGLIFDCIKILEWCREINPEVKHLIENVKMKQEFLDQYDLVIGDSQKLLINSSLVSGQKRERYYWTNFYVGKPEDTEENAHAVLENSHYEDFKKISDFPEIANARVIPEKTFSGTVNEFFVEQGSSCFFAYSSSGRVNRIEHRANLSGKANTLTTGDGCCGGLKSANFVGDVFNGEVYFRKLKVRECARLQKIPDWYSFDAVSNAQAYRAIGNGWTISVIEHILKHGLGLVSIKDEDLL